jgi:putative spermidine/putrescine transport system ATP-binding protein/spermidine/putrescine transport system ATP-binding protein
MGGIIEIANLTKTYRGGVVAVDDLSLEVGEGEFVTLLGPSGCGKTTTLRMIAGFETPTKGRIYLAGEDVTELPPYRRQVNTVFQDYALFPHMTIRDNVGYGLRVSGVPKSEIAPRVAEALTTVGLLEKAEARPGNLSGGQKQRVALARALVRNPKVLLLDEPLSALDAKLREAMQVELKHLHQRLGLTFVFVTHDQTEALVMSDRVVVMDRGKIVQSGAPTELYDDPATPYVANFIGTSNMIRGEVAHANGELTAVRFAGGELHATSGSARFGVGQKVVASVRPEKVQLRGEGEAPAGHAVIEGTVIDSLFHGKAFRLEVDIRQGTPFLVDIQLTTGARLARVPATGAAVALVVDPQTVSLFPAEAEETP